MTEVLNFLTLIPLLILGFVQLFKVNVPVFKAHKSERDALQKELDKKYCTGGVFNIIYSLLSMWFLAAIFCMFFTGVDAWGAYAALSVVKVMAVIWLCMYLKASNYIKLKK